MDRTSAQRLLLSPRDPELWLPLVTQTEYLGLIVSYGPFELQSLRHRVAKANGRRWAMASILHSRKLSVGYKLQFWAKLRAKYYDLWSALLWPYR